jgi:hypothetical protein
MAKRCRIKTSAIGACWLAFTLNVVAEDLKPKPAPSAALQAQEAQQQSVQQQQLKPSQLGATQAKATTQDMAKIAEILGDMPGGHPAQLQIERAAQSMINELNAE